MKRGDRVAFSIRGRDYIGHVTAATSAKRPGMIRVSYCPFIQYGDTELRSKWIPVEGVEIAR